MAGATLAAPELMPYEVSNVLRRRGLAATINELQARQARTDLLALPVEYWPYHAFADRAFELRANLTSYDAAYMALAEAIDGPLITLDRRPASAPGLRCEVIVPASR